MKKRILTFALSLLLVISAAMNVAAVEIKSVSVKPALSFSGTTATCQVTVSGASGKTVNVIMELWNGSTRVARWDITGTANLTITRTCNVIKGNTYTLKVSGTIGGNAFTATSITKTC